MLDWFARQAPIRTKFRALLVVTTTLGLTATAATVLGTDGTLAPVTAIALSAGAMVLAVLILALAGGAIAAPYVATVERMEALAENDLSSAIHYTNHGDCLGRISRAMEIFRAKAQEQQVQNEQYRHVETLFSQLGAALQKMGRNELDCQIRDPFPGQYEQVRHDFNGAVNTLADAIEAVGNSARHVLNGANEIHSASNDLSNRNEQQAATLEETAAAMNQVTEGVRESARSAHDVQKSITEAHQEATEGGVVVSRAVEAMAAIERSAQEISQIIGVIDGIAFQTNLLALNAGVEAARAGDAGKGFAVVANEVRALAQRSAEASKDIRNLIGTSVDQVTRGVSLVDQSGQAFARITGKVADIASLAVDIAKLSREQASNLVQINESVGDIDRNTQANAAVAEEATAAARSLASQAQELAQMVARFRIERADYPGQFNAGHADVASFEPHGAVPLARPAAKKPPKLTSVARTQGALAIKQAPEQAAQVDDWSEF